MINNFSIDEILISPSRIAVLRVLARGRGKKATGREIARLSGYSAPSAHEALKGLYSHGVLKRDIIGKQHVYVLDEENRMVRKFIRPLFAAEGDFREEIRDFLLRELKDAGIKHAVVSLILYGSVQKGGVHGGSDVDIAVVVSSVRDAGRAAGVLHTVIAERFKAYFGVQLDAYVKSAGEFRGRLKKNQPPVSSLMQSYSVLYGKEPLEV